MSRNVFIEDECNYVEMYNVNHDCFLISIGDVLSCYEGNEYKLTSEIIINKKEIPIIIDFLKSLQ